EDDILCIKGTKQVTGGYVDSYNDHRIAMAASVAAIKSRNAIIVDHAQAVNKSYPDFFRHLQALHIQCSFND
ncbi:MAG TPA: hypothetical protein VEB40_12140, partial [Flavipsychrobacter sp.]|nr:hypothetical protein [Flavipsychrobacter sp.]